MLIDGRERVRGREREREREKERKKEREKEKDKHRCDRLPLVHAQIRDRTYRCVS